MHKIWYNPTNMSFTNKIKELIKYRQLISSLIFRDLADRYKRSSLGFLWAVVEPLGLMAIYTIVFSLVIKLNIADYPIFLLCGILPWIYFSKSLFYCTESIMKDSHLVKKVYFPREALPISSVLARLINFIISLFLLLIFLFLINKLIINPVLIWFIPVILIQTIFTIGIALILAPLNVYYRDVKLLLEFVILVWFYATPVFYPLSMVPVRLKTFYILNPMVGIISSYRNIILGNQAPLNIEFYLAALISIFLFFVGFLVFAKLNRRIGELV